MNILVSSAGGPAAICCIKALRMASRKYRIIGVDVDSLAAGLFLSDKSFIVPSASNEKALLEKTLDICKSEEIKIIMPTSDFDTPVHAKYRKLFEEMGIFLPFSDYPMIQLCMDKLSLYHHLNNSGIMPFTTDNIEEITPPFIIKQRTGIGLRSTFMCNSKQHLTCLLEIVKNPIFQEPLSGKEYTVDVLSDLKGTPLLAVPRERIETKAGVTSKGRIVLDEEIQRICLDVAKKFNLKGPSCMQLKRDGNGRPKLIDLNPRLGGGTIITAIAGVNFPDLTVRLCNQEKIRIPKPREITVTRYWEEIVV